MESLSIKEFVEKFDIPASIARILISRYCPNYEKVFLYQRRKSCLKFKIGTNELKEMIFFAEQLAINAKRQIDKDKYKQVSENLKKIGGKKCLQRIKFKQKKN